MTGAEFKAIREAAGLTQASLANWLGVSTRTVNGQEAKEHVDLVYARAIERVVFLIAADRRDPYILPAGLIFDAQAICDEIGKNPHRPLTMK